jgi:hypothetical protein
MGNIRYVDADHLPFPKSCRRCGSRENCVDFGVDFHEEDLPASIARRGAIIFCISCFDEAVRSTGLYIKIEDIPEPEEPEKDLSVEAYKELVRRARLIANDLNNILDDSYLNDVPVGDIDVDVLVADSEDSIKDNGKVSVSKGNVSKSKSADEPTSDGDFGLGVILGG